MASRDRGRHKPRHHTQSSKSARVVLLPPLSAASAGSVAAAAPASASTQTASASLQSAFASDVTPAASATLAAVGTLQTDSALVDQPTE